MMEAQMSFWEPKQSKSAGAPPIVGGCRSTHPECNAVARVPSTPPLQPTSLRVRTIGRFLEAGSTRAISRSIEATRLNGIPLGGQASNVASRSDPLRIVVDASAVGQFGHAVDA